MKLKQLFLPVILSCVLFSCSKEATDAANSNDVDPKQIEGLWRETSTGLKIAITDVNVATSPGGGMGRIIECGTAYPASAQNGYPMRQVVHQSGRYWEARNYTFFPPNTWTPGSIIGLTMNENKTQFQIGSAIYVRQ